MINELNKRFLKFSFSCENKSIDKGWGTHGSRQRINNKLIQVGYKMLVLEAYGRVVQFKPYQGVTKEKRVASSTKWRLGENVVLGLMKCLPPTVSHHIFLNNYFTSFRLLIHFGFNNIRATGVLNKNRLSNCIIIGDKQLQKRNVATLNIAYQEKKAV